MSRIRVFARNVRARIAAPIAGNFQRKMPPQCKAIEWRGAAPSALAKNSRFRLRSCTAGDDPAAEGVIPASLSSATQRLRRKRTRGDMGLRIGKNALGQLLVSEAV
ncbi:hypothetical protein BEL01nite_53580 [Bradyrhizobium elkanii]|nr:hypothetical protein BEL01nite_53580 [Bradyrhizobium elkanii]